MRHTDDARPLTGSARANTRPSTTGTRIPSNRARSAVGIRAARSGGQVDTRHVAFEKHPRGMVSASPVERHAPCMADTPRRTLDERLADARRGKAARKSGNARRKCNVSANVGASRAARHSHGDTPEYRRHEERRERGRKRVYPTWNSVTRYRPATHAHCTTTCGWPASSPSVSTVSACAMRTMTRLFGTVGPSWRDGSAGGSQPCRTRVPW